MKTRREITIRVNYEGEDISDLPGPRQLVEQIRQDFYDVFDTRVTVVLEGDHLEERPE